MRPPPQTQCCKLHVPEKADVNNKYQKLTCSPGHILHLHSRRDKSENPKARSAALCDFNPLTPVHSQMRKSQGSTQTWFTHSLHQCPTCPRIRSKAETLIQPAPGSDAHRARQRDGKHRRMSHALCQTGLDCTWDSGRQLSACRSLN